MRHKILVCRLHAKAFHNLNYNSQNLRNKNLIAVLPTPQENDHDKRNLFYMVNLDLDLHQKVSQLRNSVSSKTMSVTKLKYEHNSCFLK